MGVSFAFGYNVYKGPFMCYVMQEVWEGVTFT